MHYQEKELWAKELDIMQNFLGCCFIHFVLVIMQYLL